MNVPPIYVNLLVKWHLSGAVANGYFLSTGLVYQLNMIYVNYDGRHNGRRVHLTAK